MANKKHILLIGIDPSLIDFSSPEFAAFPGLNAEKVEAGIKGSIAELSGLGYETQLCWTDFGQTAASVVQKALQNNSYDGILIGAGIRVPVANFILFEQLINVLHEHGPKAKICFNTNPRDTVASIQRWL
jgi:hypothetical protein